MRNVTIRWTARETFAQTHKLITEIFQQKPSAPRPMRTIIISILSFLVSAAAELLRVFITRFSFSSFLISFIFYTLS